MIQRSTVIGGISIALVGIIVLSAMIMQTQQESDTAVSRDEEEQNSFGSMSSTASATPEEIAEARATAEALHAEAVAMGSTSVRGLSGAATTTTRSATPEEIAEARATAEALHAEAVAMGSTSVRSLSGAATTTTRSATPEEIAEARATAEALHAEAVARGGTETTVPFTAIE